MGDKIEFQINVSAEGIWERIYLKNDEPIVVLKFGKSPDGLGHFVEIGWLRHGDWLKSKRGPFTTLAICKEVADAIAIGIEAITGGAEYLVPTPKEGAEQIDGRGIDSPTKAQEAPG